MNEPKMIEMDLLLQSEDKDLLWTQIRVRVDLANQMFGTLYKNILADQIATLYEHRATVAGRPLDTLVHRETL